MASGGTWAIAAILLALSSIVAAAEVSDFGDVTAATPPPARVIGGHARGCLAGGEALPLEGEGYQIMRPSRNRFWGHPQLVAFVTQFAAQMHAEGWSGLLIGDMAQPRGGPMSSGHRSHQSGLDVDIWFLAVPTQPFSEALREDLSAVSMVTEDGRATSAAWTEGHVRLLQSAASFPQVDRIFVNPAIKRELCNSVAGDRRWLGKLRPWWGHDTHFHVGLHCPPNDSECLERTPPVPDGDGCDKSLDWWFSDEAREEGRKGPKPRSTLDELPPACRQVLGGG